MVETIKKQKEVILYLVFGVLTTLINIVTFYIMNDVFHVYYMTSNVIAWITSVLFAFITNKLFVFESRNKTKKENTYELVSFFGFRLLSLGIDMLCMYVLISLIHVNDLISKIIVNVIVVVLNYVFSKVIIFKK